MLAHWVARQAQLPSGDLPSQTPPSPWEQALAYSSDSGHPILSRSESSGVGTTAKQTSGVRVRVRVRVYLLPNDFGEFSLVL